MKIEIVQAHSAYMRGQIKEKSTIADEIYEPKARHLLLIFLNHHAYITGKDSVTLTPTDLAEQTQLSRQHVARCLKELAQEGLIKVENKYTYKLVKAYNYREDYLVPLSLVTNRELSTNVKLFILRLQMMQNNITKNSMQFDSLRSLREATTKDHEALKNYLTTLNTYGLLQKTKDGTGLLIDLKYIYKKLDEQELEFLRKLLYDNLETLQPLLKIVARSMRQRQPALLADDFLRGKIG